MFEAEHLVQFYETDMMGIVHHSNYLRFCEEARVAWADSKGLLDYQKKDSAAQLAVLETRVKHLKATFFADKLKIQVQAKHQGIRIFFQYRLIRAQDQELVAVAETVHAPLDSNLKPKRLSAEMKSALEKEKWTETWL